MLRTNLATRPFYNERAVYLLLGVVALLGCAVLASLVLRVMDLSERNTDLTARAEQAEREGEDLSTRTTEVQRTASPLALEEVAAAAREANTLIDQRVFSWTQFFNRVETTLPPDVMLTEVRPDIAPGSVEVSMRVVGRELQAISDFIGALEESGAFARVLNVNAELTDDGMYTATLRGRYVQELHVGLLPDDPLDSDLAPERQGDESEQQDANAGSTGASGDAAADEPETGDQEGSPQEAPSPEAEDGDEDADGAPGGSGDGGRQEPPSGGAGQ